MNNNTEKSRDIADEASNLAQDLDSAASTILAEINSKKFKQ